MSLGVESVRGACYEGIKVWMGQVASCALRTDAEVNNVGVDGEIYRKFSNKGIGR